MKKLLLASTFIALSATAAQAQLNVDIGFGSPTYVERPVYVAHPDYYRTYGHGEHHHNYDYDYWKREHREDDHHDNGHHYGREKIDHRR